MHTLGLIREICIWHYCRRKTPNYMRNQIIKATQFQGQIRLPRVLEWRFGFVVILLHHPGLSSSTLSRCPLHEFALNQTIAISVQIGMKQVRQLSPWVSRKALLHRWGWLNAVGGNSIGLGGLLWWPNTVKDDSGKIQAFRIWKEILNLSVAHIISIIYKSRRLDACVVVLQMYRVP